MKCDDLGLVRMYQSATTGVIVDSPMKLVAQVFQTLFKCHMLDLRWKIVWLMKGTQVR